MKKELNYNVEPQFIFGEYEGTNIEPIFSFEGIELN